VAPEGRLTPPTTRRPLLPGRNLAPLLRRALRRLGEPLHGREQLLALGERRFGVTGGEGLADAVVDVVVEELKGNTLERRSTAPTCVRMSMQ